MKGSGRMVRVLAGGRHSATTIPNTRNVAVLTANTTGTPLRAISRPAIAGPTARATLMLTELSVDAVRSCARGTSSGISDWYAGNVRTDPEPSRNVKMR